MQIGFFHPVAMAILLCLPLSTGAAAQSSAPDTPARSPQEIRQDRELADRMIGFGNAAGARELLARLCHDDGDDIACQNLGVMAMTGEGGEVDMAAGRAAFARGCDLQLPEACQNLADAMVSGDGGPVEDGRALSLYYQLCTRGYGGRNCHRAGMMIEAGRGVAEPDAAKAREAYARACDLGFRPACQRMETGS